MVDGSFLNIVRDRNEGKEKNQKKRKLMSFTSDIFCLFKINSKLRSYLKYFKSFARGLYLTFHIIRLSETNMFIILIIVSPLICIFSFISSFRLEHASSLYMIQYFYHFFFILSCFVKQHFQTHSLMNFCKRLLGTWLVYCEITSGILKSTY